MKSFFSHESYYQCDCGYEVAILRQYNDEPIVEIAICSHSPKIKDWKEQLRWIWHIILNKEIWSDQIILNHDEAYRLGKQLTKLTETSKCE